MNSIKIFCPASVANLSCGFDILGLCLDSVGDEMIITKIEEKKIIIKINSEYDLTEDPLKNAAGISVIKMLEFLNFDECGFRIQIDKKIKPGSGIGSSAASSAGSVYGVNKLLGNPLTKKQLITFALEGEKICSNTAHADNISPLIYGGITIVRNNKTLDIVKINTSNSLFISIMHPQIEIKTKDSRKLIKRKVDFSESVQQSANLAGFITGLFHEDYDLIKRSCNDLLIEPYRSILIPEFDKLKKIAYSNNSIGFGISGSGPSMFSLTKNFEDAISVEKEVQKHYIRKKISFKYYISKINNEGIKVIN